MIFITIFTVSILIVMGMFHFYWAFGGMLGLDKALPTKNGTLLLNPSRVLTFFVGLLLIIFAYIAYSLEFHDFIHIMHIDFYRYAGVFLSLMFTIRAIGEFNVVGFFKKVKNTEFATYDTKYFSPLCLLLGISFAILTYM